MLLFDKSIEFILPKTNKKSQCADSQRIAISSNFGVFRAKEQLVEKSAKMRADFCLFRVVTDCKQMSSSD